MRENYKNILDFAEEFQSVIVTMPLLGHLALPEDEDLRIFIQEACKNSAFRPAIKSVLNRWTQRGTKIERARMEMHILDAIQKVRSDC